MEVRRSDRLKNKMVEKKVVGPQTEPLTWKFHFPAASEWTREEMNLLRCRFDKSDSNFRWDELWNKAGPVPAELQQRKSQSFAQNLSVLGIEAGVDDLQAVKIKELLNQSQDLVFKRVVYFRTTFYTLVDLAREKKDSTTSGSIPSIAVRISTSNSHKRPAETTEVPSSKKPKSAFSRSPSLSSQSPERLTASPKSRRSQTSATSETSVQSADEDYTRQLLMNFVADCRNLLGPEFYTPRWGNFDARLANGYSPLITF